MVPRVCDQVDGFDVKVNRVEDQDEPHVHVYKSGIEYRISLITGRVMTYGGRGASTKAQGREAERLVAENIKACWTEWNKWHKSKAKKQDGTTNQRTRK
jgi:hypothetical protein